ncbi:MAG: hypothetical protein PHH08_05235 [Candidatus ainarchaeum sp.]|nr:hypothetical protein [Candidatus ainarchaeum sp.]
MYPEQTRKAMPLIAQQYLIWEAQGPISAASAKIICRRALEQIPIFVKFMPEYAEAAEAEKKSISDFLQTMKNTAPHHPGYILEPLLTRFEAYNRAAILDALGIKKGKLYLKRHDTEMKKLKTFLEWSPESN